MGSDPGDPGSDVDDAGAGEPEPARRGGGLRLPGLKHWRLRRGMSRVELALRVGLTTDYLYKVETGRRGCNGDAL